MVSADELRAAAAAWRLAHGRLAELGRDVLLLPITDYLDTTLFDGLLSAYNTLTDLVGARGLDGSGVARHIADTLVDIADTYAEAEATNRTGPSAPADKD